MRKIFLIILLILILFGLADFVQAAECTTPPCTIVAYPDLPNVPDPTEGVPQFIKYIFVFSLGIVGIVGLIAIIIAAFQYVTSVGNPQKASEAKDRIFAAILGILLLLGSYLILNTINPDLLKLKGDVVGEGVEVYVGDETTVEEAGCRLIGGAWDEFIIDVGQRATLSFTLASECWNHSPSPYDENFFEEPRIRLMQKNPGAGGELDCHHYHTGEASISGIPGKDKPTINWRYRFMGQCAFWGPGTNCPFWGGGICNLIKDAPEIFYVKGKTKITNGAIQYIPSGLDIQVRDAELVTGQYMCIIDTGNAGPARTGCSSAEPKYLYAACLNTEPECKKYCADTVKAIDPAGTLGVKVKECKESLSPGSCWEALGCY